MSKKILYIIPGFGESIKDDGYKRISMFANKNGYKVIPIEVIWKNRTASRWLTQIREVVDLNGHENATVLGFSFGAYLTILLSQEYKFKKIIVCSLSPYFSDDIKNLPMLAHKILGKRRIENFKQIHFPKNNLTSAVFCIGLEDLDIVINRVKKAYKVWSGSKEIIFIEKVGHEIENESYLQKIYDKLKKE